MNKKYLYLVLVFLCSARLFAQSNNAGLVKEEASLKALSYLNLIPYGQERAYGFNSRADFAKIKIEEPYLTYYVSTDYGKLTWISGNEWRVPLSVEGQYVVLLTVQMNNGKAEVVDVGGNVLARKMQEFEKLHLNHGAEHVLIRNTFLKQDFIPSDFTALYNRNGDVLEINTASTELIYQLNEGQPIATNMAFFCEQTLDLIRNTDYTK